MEDKKVEFSYIGKMMNNGMYYEVISDDSNDKINLFYKNTREGEVECWSLIKSEVEKTLGKNILDKIKRYWINLSSINKTKRESLLFLQVFPLEMWNDIIVPIKNGQEFNVKFETV